VAIVGVQPGDVLIHVGDRYAGDDLEIDRGVHVLGRLFIDRRTPVEADRAFGGITGDVVGLDSELVAPGLIGGGVVGAAGVIELALFGDLVTNEAEGDATRRLPMRCSMSGSVSGSVSGRQAEDTDTHRHSDGLV
jgi:hypothetical protein